MQLQEDRRNISESKTERQREQIEYGEMKTCSCRKTDEIYQRAKQKGRRTDRERGGRQTETVRRAGSYFKPYRKGDWQKDKNSTKTRRKPDNEDIRSLLFVVVYLSLTKKDQE